MDPFVGREAVDSGRLTRHRLRSEFVPVYPGIYVPADATLTPVDRAQAARRASAR